MDNREPEFGELPADSDEPKGLLDAFFEYINFEFLNDFVEQTDLYSVQKQNHNSINTSLPEILKYTGVEILMGTYKLEFLKLECTGVAKDDLM